MRTVSELDAALSDARGKLSQRRADLAAIDERQSSIQAEYGRLSARAVNEGDAAAKRQLDDMDAEVFKAGRERVRLTSAIGALADSIAELESERGEAERVETLKQIADEEKALLHDCVRLDDGIAKFISALDVVRERRKTLLALAQKVGAPTKAYDKLLVNLRHATTLQLFPDGGTWLDRANTEVYRQKVAALVEDVLRKQTNGGEEAKLDVAS
jgi:hypothetical protein